MHRSGGYSPLPVITAGSLAARGALALGEAADGITPTLLTARRGRKGRLEPRPPVPMAGGAVLQVDQAAQSDGGGLPHPGSARRDESTGAAAVMATLLQLVLLEPVGAGCTESILSDSLR